MGSLRELDGGTSPNGDVEQTIRQVGKEPADSKVNLWHRKASEVTGKPKRMTHMRKTLGFGSEVISDVSEEDLNSSNIKKENTKSLITT